MIAYFNCFNGIAGDMALGALVDAGADPDAVRSLIERMPVDGWDLQFESVMRNGIGGTQAHVDVVETTVARTYGNIVSLIDAAEFPPRMHDRVVAIFDVLATAEGHLHRRPKTQVHFHEVGALDSIVDIVGVCAALEILNVTDVQSSAVTTGTGMIKAAHGILPNPSPAVVELLHGAPMVGVDVNAELTTPTGAAILAALCSRYGSLPPMIVGSSGFGAGTKVFDDRANLVQVVLGTALADAQSGTIAAPLGQPAIELAVNVDDATGEMLAHAIAALMDAGAHDAWLTPIVMKKGRPAYVVTALADIALADQIGRVLLSTTGSFGLRSRGVDRWPLARTDATVTVDGLPVRVKVGLGRAKVEFDDAAAAARHSGRTVRDVISIGEHEWRTHTHEHDHDHTHDHSHEHDGHTHS